MVEKKNPTKRVINRVMMGLVTAALLFSIGSMIFVKNMYGQHFPRVEARKNSGYLRYSDVTGYDRRIVKFKSGPNTLTGYVYGEHNQKGLVVIAHGLGFGAEDYLAETLYFVDHGWRVFAFDNTGTRESEGKNTVGLAQSVIDLGAALRFIESDATVSNLPTLLYGHSWGGYAVTAILNGNRRIMAVASLSGFNSPMGLLTEQFESMLGPFAYAEVPFGWAYQRMLFGDTAGRTAVDGINHSTIPVMIIHGDADEAIAYQGASIIARRKEITNPKVIYKTCSTVGHNGHNNLFESEAASQYIKELNQVYKALNERYDGNIPDDVKAQYYTGVDRFKTSELDADFMNAINRFFEDALISRTE